MDCNISVFFGFRVFPPALCLRDATSHQAHSGAGVGRGCQVRLAQIFWDGMLCLCCPPWNGVGSLCGLPALGGDRNVTAATSVSPNEGGELKNAGRNDDVCVQMALLKLFYITLICYLKGHSFILHTYF